MDVRFPSFNRLPTPATPAGSPAGPASGAPAGQKGFAGTLTEVLKNVSTLQEDSASLQKQFQMGGEGASLEQTMIAMQKAQVGFQAALTVRNRFVAAYTDIMNMQV